jgi:hypothetical protein
MTSPYRALCAELLAALEIQLEEMSFDNRLCIRARAELAKPEPKGPTDEELMQLAREWNSGYESIDFDCIADYAREVLTRCG